MKETIYLGSSPPEEDCAQVGSDDYHVKARAECQAYRNQLYRFLKAKGYSKGDLPADFALTIKSEQHDYGTYLEVVVRFNSEDEKSWDLAQLLEGESPTEWDQEARDELNYPIA